MVHYLSLPEWVLATLYVIVISVIHIPAGERDKYVTSSLADSSVVGKEKKSNDS